ncbi:hypothetical protein PMAYCL1PPCAC_14003, partial [Pristionchus mayeri]
SYDFSVRENDTLNGLFMKIFDMNSVILKNSENRITQRALENLNGKRSKYQRFENTNEKSIRSVMYGIIESLHLTIVHLLEQEDPSETSISIVEQWKRKARLTNLVTYCSSVKTKFFFSSQLNIRYVMFGVIESLHLTLLHLMDETNVTILTNQSSKQSEEINNPSLLVPRPIEDPFDVSHSIPHFDEDSSMNAELKKIKKQSKTSCKPIEYVEISDEDDEPFMKISKSESVEGKKDSSMNAEVKKRKKPSKTSSKPIEHVEISDEDDEPMMKISKSESGGRNKIASSSTKGSSKSDCVKRGLADKQKNRLETDLAVANVPCVYSECETYPKTVRSYEYHLAKFHNSTLLKNGIYLICSCGLKVRTCRDRAHGKECDKRSYTLHRIDEE